MAVHPEPDDPLDTELAELQQHPEVQARLDDYDRRRREGQLGRAASHDAARRAVGLEAEGDTDSDGE